ncbi:MAG TPA: ABC transporter permease [Phycisphaerae bacterium]|nr:ABC transporter permease [Phycisphaerae bacterium]HRY70566.1 ABC transporter permease [Phycisphaerae bacterium]HSA28384.1 ABC transporter permease [Phycisphaerae bacterium]
MNLSTLRCRSLEHHWRAHLATVLACAAATAVITGALLVGDSMRGSLADLAVGRLGRVEMALVSPHFLRTATVDAFRADPDMRHREITVAEAILLRGNVAHADTGARVNQTQIAGIDDRFWAMATHPVPRGRASSADRSVVLNESLAGDLGAKIGDEVLIRVAKQDGIPVETLLGRRDSRPVTLRLAVGGVIPDDGLGGFSLHRTQYHPRTAFVPLSVLQRALRRPDQVNTILVSRHPGGAEIAPWLGALRLLYSDSPSNATRTRALQVVYQGVLSRFATLQDLGLSLRQDQEGQAIVAESAALMVSPTLLTELGEASARTRCSTLPVFSYLANTIAVEQRVSTQPGWLTTSAPSPVEVPYSTIAAVGLGGPSGRFILTTGETLDTLKDDEILLNEWTAAQLGVESGDRIALSYHLIGEFGQLRTETAVFRLRGMVRMQGLAGSRALTPVYEGLTDAKRLSDWAPPFPIDLKRIRPVDEKYWDDHGPTPKAFLPMTAGLRLWGKEYERFGTATSLRIYPPSGVSLDAATSELEKALQLPGVLDAAGLRFEPVRANALAAAKGNTDFAMLFLSLSFLIVFSAALLIALMFRLGLDRRSGELGLLLALGFRPQTVRKLLLGEGLALAGIGCLFGLAAGVGYAGLMLAGLRSWWSAAVHAPFLRLHVGSLSLLIGLSAGMVVAWVSIRWSLRGFSRASARSLLAGEVLWGSQAARLGSGRSLSVVVLIALAAGLVVTLAGAMVLPQTIAFFVAGIVMLTACLAGMNAWIRAGRRGVIGPGPLAAPKLGIRNATRHRRRSLMTTALIAAAAFNIVAVGASHRKPGPQDRAKDGGTGGFALMAESTMPLLPDLNAPAGRSALNVTPTTQQQMAESEVMPFRVRPGDDASCLNLYSSRSPRIFGATDAMVRRGGFSFQSFEGNAEFDPRNPWTLLTSPASDGAVPAVGDANTVMWMLHIGLGGELTVEDEVGRPVKLRIVGVLSGSVLQGGLIIAEREFVRLWPSIGGYSFFLIEAPVEKARAIEQALERDLGDYGFDAVSTTGRLADYMAVENTYLSTFQTLGGLGLMLGTVGLGAVMLRNVWERRRELALLQAVGFRQGALAVMVLAENAVLLVCGLVAGSLSAGLAIAPHAVRSLATIPWLSLASTLVGVLAAGMIAGAVAVVPALRTQLLAALRTE